MPSSSPLRSTAARTSMTRLSILTVESVLTIGAPTRALGAPASRPRRPLSFTLSLPRLLLGAFEILFAERLLIGVRTGGLGCSGLAFAVAARAGAFFFQALGDHRSGELAGDVGADDQR